jgi:hypothetical protein
MNESLELLTPGSVWVKEDGKQAKVLFVTNTTLPVRHQEKHPIQIIYANDEADIYSRTLDSFFKIYKFYNIDPELEERLENLITFSEDSVDEDDSDDEDDGGELILPLAAPTEEVQPEAVKVIADALKVEAEDSSRLTQSLADYLSAKPEEEVAEEITPDEDGGAFDTGGIMFLMSEGDAPSNNSSELESAFVSYSQEPNKQLSITLHKLTFRLGNGVTLETLKDVFIPDDQRSIVDAFLVRSDFYEELVPWTDYIGIYPELVYGRAFASVIVATENSPLIDEQEAQAHIHTPTEAVEELTPAQYAAIQEAVAEQVVGIDANDVEEFTTPGVGFESTNDMPQVDFASVVAATVDEINRHQASQTLPEGVVTTGLVNVVPVAQQ